MTNLLVTLLLQTAATIFLAIVGFSVLKLEDRRPRIYAACGLLGGLAAIWKSIDQAAATRKLNLEVSEVILLAAGVWIFAKSVEISKDRGNQWLGA